MKYLDLATLANSNTLLDGQEAGEYTLVNRIEAFSCKRSGSDKQLARSLTDSLERSFSDSEGAQSLEEVVSPFGPLTDGSSRKTFFYLVGTLNAAFPDYDFSTVTSKDFRKENLNVVVHQINNALTTSLPTFPNIQTIVWKSLDDEINLRDCDVYTYVPDPDSDPFGEEVNLWSFNFFFYNRKMKRVIYWTCRAKSKVAERDESFEEGAWSYADEVYESMDTAVY
eukprot:TRINITY_DN1666_c0_g3_i1.p1 TRINITY_DN1666_c0_g3~~TRINITY_DN1666_c0_g3_i1.p1  ORF type:complete len:248 (+),score=61.97 TRINITY_DN1666_c0_g3_i1:71-745(+)